MKKDANDEAISSPEEVEMKVNFTREESAGWREWFGENARHSRPVRS